MSAKLTQAEYHTRRHCRNLRVDTSMQPHKFGRQEWKVPVSWKEGYQAAREGCPLFAVCLKRRGLPGFRYAYSLLELPSRYRGQEQGDAPRPFTIILAGHGVASIYDAVTEESVDMFLSCSKLDPAANDLLTRPFIKEPQSKDVLDFLRTQITNCLNSHPSCDDGSSLKPPRRLLYIETEPPRLVESARENMNKWCALSYCWGTSSMAAITRATLPDRLGGIDMAILPKTIRDAITVCRGLSVPHIWIDALCIVQDDEEERTEDIADMVNVYSGAFFTLSASRAADTADGFLGVREIEASDPNMDFEAFSIRYLCRDGQEGHLLFQPKPASPKDPISLRGWVLQERVLSPRLMEFSQQQVRWRCKSVKTCDSGYSPGGFHFPESDVLSTSWDSPGYAVWLYHYFVRNYSARKLSMEEDRLPAFSAIAAILGQSPVNPGGNPANYLAGIFAATLPESLLWFVENKKLLPRPRKYLAPTWSWARVNGSYLGRYPCGGPSSEGMTNWAKIISHNVQLTHPSVPYGMVSGGSLVIMGKAARAKWYYNRRLPGHEYPISDVCIGAQNHSGLSLNDIGVSRLVGKGDAVEEGWCQDDEEAYKKVQCLLIVRDSLQGPEVVFRGLMLLEIPSESDGEIKYRRVGYWETSDFEGMAKFTGPKTFVII